MDENLQNIEELFHSQLEDNEILPSENTWNEIDKRLDKDNLIIIRKKYNSLKKLAAVLLLLLLCFTVFELTKTHKNNYSIKDDSFVKTEQNVITVNKTNSKNDPNNNADKMKAIAENNTASNAEADKILNNENSKTTSANKTEEQKNELLIDKSTTENKELQNQSPYTPFNKNKFISKAIFKANIQPSNASFDDETLNEMDKEKQIPFLRKSTSEELLLPINVFNFGLKNKILLKLQIDIAQNNIELIKEKNKKKTGSGRFSLTPFFSPDIAWYSLQDDKQGSNIENAAEIDKEERAGFSYTYGVMADYKINKHWGIQSGISISNTQITTDPKQIYAQPDGTGNIKYRINTSSGYGFILPSFSTNPTAGDSLFAFTSTHELQYFSMPLAISYNIPKGKLNFKVMAGVSANILTRAKLETTVEKGFNNELETVDNIQGLKKIYFSGLSGVGVDYKLNHKISLTVAPILRFALNSINKDAAVKSYPVSLGFNVGLKIHL